MNSNTLCFVIVCKCVCVRVFYFRSIVAKWNMRTSPWLHGKSHNLSFDKDEQQNKHLEDSQDSAQSIKFKLLTSVVNRMLADDKQNQRIT